MRRSGRSRPSSCRIGRLSHGIDPRRRRPHAFDQPAENDAVGFRQPRFELAVDMRACASPIPAAAPCGRRTRSGTLRDSRRAGPSGRFGCSACRADRRTRDASADPWLILEDDGDAVLIAATAPSAPRDGVAPARQNHSGFDECDAFQRRKRLLQRARSADCARSSSSSLSLVRCSAAMQRRRLAAPQLGQLGAEALEIAREAAAARLRPRAAQQRQFRAPRWRRCSAPARRPAGTADASAAPAASAAQALWRRLRGEPGENARRRVHQARRRRNRRIARFQRPQRRHHPPRQRAIRRHQRRRFARDAAPRASRPRSPAPPSRDWAPRRRRDSSCRAKSFGDTPARASRSMPLRGRVRRPHRLGHQHIAPMRRRRRPRSSTSPRLMPNRSSSACIANCGWFDAGGVVNLPCASRDAADRCCQAIVVEIGIEPRQHHRAVRQTGHGVEEFCGRRHRAGRTCRDHRTRHDARSGALASASIKRSRRAAGSILPISRR